MKISRKKWLGVAIGFVVLFLIFFDLRHLSDPMHALGHGLVRLGIPFEHAMRLCPAFLKYGCAHGAIMQHIESESLEISAAFATCDDLEDNRTLYRNCIHGAGHIAYLAQKLPPEKGVHICHQFESDTAHACASGVFMEYALSMHAHDSQSHYRQLPCKRIEWQYQETCYASEGSYRQYQPGIESFAETFAYCNSIPAAYRLSCRAAAEERMRLSSLYHLFNHFIKQDLLP